MSGRESATTLWQAASEVLRERIPSQDFYSWFAMAEPVQLESSGLVVSLANSFAVDWVRQRFGDVLAESLRVAAGHAVPLELVSRETAPVDAPLRTPVLATAASEPALPVPASSPTTGGGEEFPVGIGADTLTEDELRTAVGVAARASMHRSADIVPVSQEELAEEHTQPLNPRYRFDTFVIGEGNQLAHAAALSVAEAPGQSYNPLYIYGGTGLGKTHLLHAIGHYAMETRPGTTVAYVTTEGFMNRFIKAMTSRTQAKQRFKGYFRGIDVLLMDDVQFLSGKGSAIQEELFYTFNALHEAGKQVVLTSDTEPRSIPQIEERLCSRFAWGLITDIATPDRATRIAILRKKAQAEGLDAPMDVLGAVADRINTNVRELEGALTRIVGYSSLTGRAVNLELAMSVLDSYAPSVREPVTIDRIQNVVCEYFDLSHDDLVGARRTADIVRPRQIAMYLARVLLGAPSTQVARRFGKKDHSTVIHAEKQIDKLIRVDREVYDLVERLTHTIRQGNSRVIR